MSTPKSWILQVQILSSSYLCCCCCCCCCSHVNSLTKESVVTQPWYGLLPFLLEAVQNPYLVRTYIPAISITHRMQGCQFQSNPRSHSSCFIHHYLINTYESAWKKKRRKKRQKQPALSISHRKGWSRYTRTRSWSIDRSAVPIHLLRTRRRIQDAWWPVAQSAVSSPESLRLQFTFQWPACAATVECVPATTIRALRRLSVST